MCWQMWKIYIIADKTLRFLVSISTFSKFSRKLSFFADMTYNFSYISNKTFLSYLYIKTQCLRIFELIYFLVFSSKLKSRWYNFDQILFGNFDFDFLFYFYSFCFFFFFYLIQLLPEHFCFCHLQKKLLIIQKNMTMSIMFIAKI